MLVLFASRQELEQGVRTQDFPQASAHILLSLDLPASRIGGQLAHEVSHSFFFDILPRRISAALPAWVSEGLSEYQRGSWDASQQAILNDFVRTNTVPRLSRLTASSYSTTPQVNNGLGHAAFDFIVDSWGTDGIRRLLFALRQSAASGRLDDPLRAAFGLAADDFDRRFEAYLTERFRTRVIANAHDGPSRLESGATGFTQITRVRHIIENVRLEAGQAAPAASAAGHTFEVASIKRNTSGAQSGMMRFLPGGRFSATNMSLRRLILSAYDLQGSQLAGGPGWLDSDTFDIEAKAGDSQASPTQVPLMLRALLAERFKLFSHNERRELPVYSLVVVRSDRKLGSELKPAAPGNCPVPGLVPPPPPPPPPPPTGTPHSVINVPACNALKFGPGGFVARGVNMDRLARSLSGLQAVTSLDRMVVDRTGLTGNFDFDLEWTPQFRTAGAETTGAIAAPQVDGGPSSVFTALQEQLGLKLEAERQPVEVVVIDRVAPPTED